MVLDWIESAHPERLALWTTLHPEWSDLEGFLRKCDHLNQIGIRYSVGVVGFVRFKEAIANLHRRLDSNVYL